MRWTAVLMAAAGVAGVARAAEVDCAEVHGGKAAATCEVVPCGPTFEPFLGEWRGPFEEYVQGLSKPDAPVLRPYDDRIRYAAQDCLRERASGDVFIVGRREDRYPAFGMLAAKVARGLLVSGRHADGSAFLRTVDEEGVHDYALESRDAATQSATWRLDVPAGRRPCPGPAEPEKTCAMPAMAFRIVDGRDPAAAAGEVRRVEIDMTVGPAAAPYWQGVLVRGHHERHALP